MNVYKALTDVINVLPLVNYKDFIGVIEPRHVLQPFEIKWHRAETHTHTYTKT